MNKSIFAAEISRHEARSIVLPTVTPGQGSLMIELAMEITTTRWEEIARGEQQRSLISDETAIHYLSRLLLCNFNRLCILYPLVVGHCGRRIMLSAFQESVRNDGERAGRWSINQNRTLRKERAEEVGENRFYEFIIKR